MLPGCSCSGLGVEQKAGLRPCLPGSSKTDISVASTCAALVPKPSHSHLPPPPSACCAGASIPRTGCTAGAEAHTDPLRPTRCRQGRQAMHQAVRILVRKRAPRQANSICRGGLHSQIPIQPAKQRGRWLRSFPVILRRQQLRQAPGGLAPAGTRKLNSERLAAAAGTGARKLDAARAQVRLLHSTPLTQASGGVRCGAVRCGECSAV